MSILFSLLNDKTTIESGNGYRIMSDKTLIQWGSFSVTVPANNYAEYGLTFHKPFSSYPCFTSSIVVWSEPKYFSILTKSPFTSNGTLRIGSTASVQTTVTVNWFAIGIAE